MFRQRSHVNSHVRGLSATALIALSAITGSLLTGCTGGGDDKKAAPKPSATSPTPAPAIDYTPWSAGRSTPVADSVYPDYGNPAVDVLHYGLNLAWNREAKTLTGQATIQLRTTAAVPSIVLDFSAAYTLEAITLDGTPATGSVTGHKLTIATAVEAEQNRTLVVTYHGTPTTVPMPSGRKDIEPLGLTVADDGSLWTMQEPYGASTWYPSNDIPSDKAMYDIAVTAPAGWAAVASGTPNGHDGNIYRYASTNPMAAYLATLAVGPLAQESAKGPHDIPLTYWYRQGADDRLMTVVRKSPQFLEWLEQRFGPYPFPSAGVVMVPSKSAMETQEMVTLGEQLIGPADAQSDTALKAVELDVLHEYSHQWFGDTVTPSTWKDLWLSEGFAQYAQYMYDIEQNHISLPAWEKWARDRDAKLRKEFGPPGSPRPESFAESNVYTCPALMLYQIRKQVGDAAFDAMAKDWAQQHRNAVQDRAAFTVFVNQHTGADLTGLIDTWLDSPTTPE